MSRSIATSCLGVDKFWSKISVYRYGDIAKLGISPQQKYKHKGNTSAAEIEKKKQIHYLVRYSFTVSAARGVVICMQNKRKSLLPCHATLMNNDAGWPGLSMTLRSGNGVV
jgi:hypothetical protein